MAVETSEATTMTGVTVRTRQMNTSAEDARMGTIRWLPPGLVDDPGRGPGHDDDVNGRGR
jgi:hypothetical protein